MYAHGAEGEMMSLTDIQQAFVRRYMNDDEHVIGVRIREINGKNVLLVEVTDRNRVELPSTFCELRVEVREGRPAILAYR
jgi:hypothetical protein